MEEYINAGKFYIFCAKLFFRIRFLISFLIPFLSILFYLLNLHCEDIFALIGLFWTIGVYIIYEIERIFLLKGAKTRELSDCISFGLPWNEIICGSKPIIREFKIAAMIGREWLNTSNFYTYSEKKAKELWQHVLLSQRHELALGSYMVNYYKVFVLVLTISYVLFSLFLGLILSLSLDKYFLVLIAPSIVLISDSFKLFYELLLYKQDVKSVITQIDNFFKMESSLSFTCREIQDYIFLKRSDSNAIPSIVFAFSETVDEIIDDISCDIIAEETEELCLLTYNESYKSWFEENKRKVLDNISKMPVAFELLHSEE